MNSFAYLFIFLFFVVFTNVQVCMADCDNLQDTCPTVPPKKQTIFINGLPCKNPANVTAQDFKTEELRNAGSSGFFGASTKIVTAAEFPGLNTLGLSIGRTDIDCHGLANFHYHPRATEMIFVTKGCLIAGFIDTQNQVFHRFLKVGDVFVLPKGLLHFYLNNGFEKATVFSVFNSQNPGLVSITAKAFDPTMESLEKLKRRIVSLTASEVHDIASFPFPEQETIYS